MPSMRCWWTQEQKDVFVLLSGREMRRMRLLNPCLVTASGKLLDQFSCRRVNLSFAGSPARLKVAFTILSVRRPILSVGSLLKHGHGVIFDRANPCFLLRNESTKSVHRIPVEARGNTFVVLGRSVSSLLALVMMEGAAAPAVPAVPGGPHADRAVLEQAMDEQPMELAEEEQARAFANPTSRISQQLDGATFVHDLVEEMPLIEKLQLPRSMRYAL